MAKLLIQYGKTGPLKHLSHLELMRAFERSFRRAGLDIAMSGGFNPRPKVSYGSALSVGVESHGEYVIIDLKTLLEPDEALKIISSVLPEGLHVFKAKYIPDKHLSIMSAVQSQAYSILSARCPDDDSLNEIIAEVRSVERLVVRHKDKEKWVETKKAILDWRVAGREKDAVEFYLLLAVGDGNAIRPEAVMKELADRLSNRAPEGGGCEIIEIRRIDQYVNRDIPLIDIYDFYEGVSMGSERN